MNCTFNYWNKSLWTCWDRAVLRGIPSNRLTACIPLVDLLLQLKGPTSASVYLDSLSLSLRSLRCGLTCSSHRPLQQASRTDGSWMTDSRLQTTSATQNIKKKKKNYQGISALLGSAALGVSSWDVRISR